MAAPFAPITVGVVACARPPFVFYYPERLANAQFSGFLPDLFDNMLLYAGYNSSIVSIIYHLCASDDSGVAVNGSWTGVMGSIVNKQYDVAVYPMPYSTEAAAAVDFTPAAYYSGISIITPLVHEEPAAFSFLSPFSFQLWMSIVATMFLVMALDYFFNWFTPFTNTGLTRIKRVDPPAPTATYVVEPTDYNFVFDNLMMFVSQGWAGFRANSWGMRIVYLYIAFFGMIIVNSYLATLAAFLTVHELSTAINALTDIPPLGQPIAVDYGSRTFDYLRTSQDPNVQDVLPLMSAVPTLDDALAAVRDGSAIAALDGDAVLTYYSSLVPCDLTVVGTPFAPVELSIVLTKGSPFTGPLSTALRGLKDTGIYDEIRRRWFDQLDQCTSLDLTLSSSQFGVTNLRGLWYILLVVIGVAFVILALEHLSVRLVARGATFKNFVKWVAGKKQENRQEKRLGLQWTFRKKPEDGEGSKGDGNVQSIDYSDQVLRA